MKNFEVTEKQIDDFYELGFFILPGLFTCKEISKVSSALDNLYKKSRSVNQTQELDGTQFVFQDKILQRIVWCGASETELYKIAEDLRILIPVSQILNSREFNQLINQAHYKLPGDNVKFKWHQDSQHRGFGTQLWQDVDGKGSYVQTVMAIDEVTQENGPIKFIPYSNHKGHLALDDDRNIARYVDESKAIDVLMKPGDVAFFGPYIIHGSFENLSKHARRVFINGYSYPGANRKEYPGEGSGRLLKVK